MVEIAAEGLSLPKTIYILLEVNGNGEAVYSYGTGEEVNVLGVYSSEENAIFAGNLFVNKPSAQWRDHGQSKILDLNESGSYYNLLQVVWRNLDTPAK